MNKFYMKKFFLFAASTSLLSLVACHSAEEIVSNGYQKSADIKDGKLVDYRDGNEYGVAKINGSYWMTENLRYADSSSMENLKGNSWCHEDDKKCTKFGRLYSWTAAMDIEKTYLSSRYVSTVNANTQGICPPGWRLPTKMDWQNLSAYVESQNGGEGAGTSLKSTETWNKSDSSNEPTNRFGFNAMASGRRNNDGKTFLSTGRIALFWTPENKDEGTAFGYQLRHEVDALEVGFFYKDHGLAVRCIANPSDIEVTGDLDSSYIDKIPHNYGTLKYEGETYRTVNINGQTWMADNLNYNAEGSYCYSDNKENCKEYGRLYTFEAAKKVCPENWRLPTVNDITYLNQFAKTSSALRSTTGWNSNTSKGLNFWGFDAKPAGGLESGDYFDLNSSAYFWINDGSSSNNASVMWINYYDSTPRIMTYNASNAYSVRCMKDSD